MFGVGSFLPKSTDVLPLATKERIAFIGEKTNILWLKSTMTLNEIRGAGAIWLFHRPGNSNNE